MWFSDMVKKIKAKVRVGDVSNDPQWFGRMSPTFQLYDVGFYGDENLTAIASEVWHNIDRVVNAGKSKDGELIVNLEFYQEVSRGGYIAMFGLDAFPTAVIAWKLGDPQGLAMLKLLHDSGATGMARLDQNSAIFRHIVESLDVLAYMEADFHGLV